MTLLAHKKKSGEEQTLAEHLTNVAENSTRIVEEKELDFNEDLSKFVEILGLCHDFGKATTLFQDYLTGKEVSDLKKQHSLISAYFTFLVLRQEGFTEKLQLLGWLITLKHHGDLENLFGVNTGVIDKKTDSETKQILKFQVEKLEENTSELYKKLEVNYVGKFKEEIKSEEIFKDLENIYRNQARERFGKKPENFFLTLFCYSVLLDSDKMDAAGYSYSEWPSVGTEPINIPKDTVDEYKKSKGWDNPESEIDEMRQEAYREAEKLIKEGSRLMTLTLPTGAGKTLTALNMALKLRESSDLERSPRIIYSLPFLSIIDQNYEVIGNVLENKGLMGKNERRPELLLRHDHLSPGYAAGESEGENPGNPILLTEGWNSEIVNTTFVQFFETLFSTKNSGARKFHKVANSIILLDEIQSLPIKYWEPVEEALKILAEKFKSKIVLMTATQPELIEKGESKEAIPESKKNEYFKKFDRIDYEFDLEMDSIEDLASEIREKANGKDDLMAVMNTRKSCEELYNELKDLKGDDREVIFLSTDLLPVARRDRIEEIKRTKKPVLVVTTQLIEAGVDIDMDRVWRDFAPLDSIVQTAGRCNREDSESKGVVKVIKLEGKRRPLHSYVYDTALTGITEEVIEDFLDQRISESDFNQRAVSEYFGKVHRRKSKDVEDVLENVKTLNFSEVDIGLIEDTESLPVFVKLDKNAIEVYSRVREIYDKPFFERRKEMQKIKSEFHSYILNVTLYTEEDKKNIGRLPSTDFSDNFKEITQDKVGKGKNVWYNTETGFQFPESFTGNRIM